MMKIKNKFARLLSGFLCIMMLVSAMPLMAGAEGEYINILLNGENFDMPNYGANSGYIANGGTATGNLFEKSMKINNNGNEVYTTAKIYIEAEGTYNAWVLSANEASDTTERYAKIGFDDETMQTAAKHKVHVWDKTTWTLTAGWHEVKLGINNSWCPTLINAVYITNNLDYIPTVETDDELLAYRSTSLPEFAADADIEYELNGEDCVITFPQATVEGGGALVYSYVIEGVETQIADITAPITLKGIYGTKVIKLVAMDYTGNMASVEFEIIGAEPPEIMFLRCDNITLTSDLAGWSYEENASTYYSMLSDGGKNLPGISTNMSIPGYDSAKYATANIIVNGGDNGAPKTYYLWPAGRSDAARPIYVAFDDSDVFAQSTVHTVTSGGMGWNKFAEGFTLTPGLHKLKIKVGGGNSGNFQGMIITEDKNYSPGKGTTYADLQSIAVIDITAPEFDSADIEVNYSEGKCDITFPEAADGENDRLAYEYTINGESYPTDSNTISLSDVAPLQKLDISVTAYDRLGNSASLEKAFTASDVQVSGFEITKDGVTVTNLSELSANDVISIKTKVTSMAQSTVNLEMTLILYSADYKRMVSYVPSSLAALEPSESNVPFNVSMTLPADFVNNDGSVIAAVLWDKDTGEPYAEGIELKGAE